MWEERGRRQRRRQRERARRHSEAGRPGPLCARAPPPSSGDGRSPGAPSCAHARPRRPRALGPAHNVNAPPRLRKGVGPLSLDTEPSFSFTHGQRASAASCRSTRHRDYFASSGPDRLCRLQLASSEHLLFPAVSPRLSSCSERTCDAALVALHRRATPESSRGSRATSRVRVRLLPACLEMHRSSQELPAAKQAVEREEDTRVAFPLVSRPGHTESSRERMRGDTGCGSIRGGRNSGCGVLWLHGGFWSPACISSCSCSSDSPSNLQPPLLPPPLAFPRSSASLSLADRRPALSHARGDSTPCPSSPWSRTGRPCPCPWRRAGSTTTTSTPRPTTSRRSS